MSPPPITFNVHSEEDLLKRIKVIVKDYKNGSVDIQILSNGGYIITIRDYVK